MIKRGFGLIFLVSLVVLNGCNSVNEVECVVAGCSSHLCVFSELAENIVTTCEYKEEYSCLKSSNCELIDGNCGWKETEEYLECLNEVRS